MAESSIMILVLLVVVFFLGGGIGGGLSSWFKDLFSPFKKEEDYDYYVEKDGELVGFEYQEGTLAGALAELDAIKNVLGTDWKTNSLLINNWYNKYVSIFTPLKMETELVILKENYNNVYGEYVTNLVPVQEEPTEEEKTFIPTLIDDRTIWHVQFKAYNKTEHDYMVDFFGYKPIGADDIDTYLSKLNKSELDSWNIYWRKVFSNRPDLLEYIKNKYNWFSGLLAKDETPTTTTPPPNDPVQPPPETPPEWPQSISCSGRTYVVYDSWQETQMRDFLGCNTDHPLDDYLRNVIDTQAALYEWRNYWVDNWNNAGRADMAAVTNDLYLYYRQFH